MIERLKKKLWEMSGHLYADHFHLSNTLTMAIGDLGLRLGTIDLGTEDSGRRLVNVWGPMIPASKYVIITWKTTECGNFEADFILT